LTAVKNVGEGAIASILSRRKEQGSVDSLFSLCEGIDLRLANKRVFESLIKAGAFDSSKLFKKELQTTGRRAQLLALVDRALEHGSRIQRDREQGQTHLFDSTADGTHPDSTVRLPEIPPWSESEQLKHEKEALGFYLSGHPIDRYRDQLEAAGAKSLAALADEHSELLVAGIVSDHRPLKTKQGLPMAVGTLEDGLGSLEVVVFPKVYERCGNFLAPDRLVLVAGKLDRDEEATRLLVDSIRPIESLNESVGKTMMLHLTSKQLNRETLGALADLFQLHRGPSLVRLDLKLVERTPPLRVQAKLTESRVRPSEQLTLAAEQICGKGTVSWK
jgi:DNA polymerase-3 subunit alpha